MKRLLPALFYTAALLLTLYAAYCSRRAIDAAHFKFLLDDLAAAQIQVWLHRRMYAVLTAWLLGTAASVLLPRQVFAKAAAGITFFCVYGVISVFV